MYIPSILFLPLMQSICRILCMSSLLDWSFKKTEKNHVFFFTLILMWLWVKWYWMCDLKNCLRVGNNFIKFSLMSSEKQNIKECSSGCGTLVFFVLWELIAYVQNVLQHFFSSFPEGLFIYFFRTCFASFTNFLKVLRILCKRTLCNRSIWQTDYVSNMIITYYKL